MDAAAALRAAADQMGCYQSKKFLYSIADAMKLRNIAAELEGIKYGTYRCELKSQCSTPSHLLPLPLNSPS